MFSHDSLGWKHLGVTLWAFWIYVLHDFFFLRSLGELMSLREGRSSCSSVPRRACSPAQGLPALLCIKLALQSSTSYFWTSYVFLNLVLLGSNQTFAIPYLKLLRPCGVQNSEMFRF